MHSLISQSETDRLAQFADTLANATDPMAMTYFRKPLDIEAKADDSPVSQADRAIEAAMRQQITDVFPTYGILGEEHEDARLDADRIWVIDPIDGTKSFMSGVPSFATLIACLAVGEPDIEVISIPPTDERWTGQPGAPSWLNGVPCCTSGQQSLPEAILYTTSPDSFDPAGLAQFETLSEKVAMRRFEGDCYAYGMLAPGHVDLLVEMNLHPYDYMTHVPVIEGAGGICWRRVGSSFRTRPCASGWRNSAGISPMISGGDPPAGSATNSTSMRWSSPLATRNIGFGALSIRMDLFSSFLCKAAAIPRPPNALCESF